MTCHLEDQKETEKALGGLGCLVVLGVFIYLGWLGWEATQKNGWTSHDMLIRVQYHNWVVGEYKNCATLNTPTPNQNLLDCSDVGGDVKVFKVLFYGGTYDEEKPETFVHNWKCRKSSEDNPAFICSLLETSAATQNPPQTQPQSTPPDTKLPDEYIENLRKRDACEQRFYEKKIRMVDGVSIGTACKENPDRRP